MQTNASHRALEQGKTNTHGKKTKTGKGAWPSATDGVPHRSATHSASRDPPGEKLSRGLSLYSQIHRQTHTRTHRVLSRVA